MRLYSYWKSSTAYRVRIALQLKGLIYEYIPVPRAAGELHNQHYQETNSQSMVPTLIDDEIQIKGQSLAIIDYLEEFYPNPSLLPKKTEHRVRAREIAYMVASDIHPLNNLRVMSFLERRFGANRDRREIWYQHWLTKGLAAIEAIVGSDSPFCVGQEPTIADICLIPQLANAHRYGIPLEAFPRLQQIEANCLALPAFQAAHPEMQPDAFTN